MPFSQRAAGLTVAADRMLPGLPAAPCSAAPDIITWINARPWWTVRCRDRVYATDRVDAAGTPSLSVTKAPEGYCLEYADRTCFWIDSSGTEIWMTWAPAATFEDACTYLVGTVLGFALRLRGELALHASAVEIAGAAVAIVGPHGAGKSTTAAAFARRGFAVVTDDLLRVVVEPGRCARAFPFGGIVRLWPDSEALVYGGGSRLPRVTPSWEKRALAIGDGHARGVASPIPVAEIVCLAPRDGRREPCVVPMHPAEALVCLAANSTAGYLLAPPARASEFQRLSSLVASVPVFEGHPATGAGSLERFVDRLLQCHGTGAPIA